MSETLVQKKQEQNRSFRKVKKNSSSSSNGNESVQNVVSSEQSTTKVPSDADLERYKKYVGQTWTGVCKWFNVSKGFGFVVPDLPESKNDDVFVHQSVLQMPGFRSLGEGEVIQFTVRLGKIGLEAENVTGIDGPIQGHAIRPVGKKKNEQKIRCYNCGKLGKHKANKCKQLIVPNESGSEKNNGDKILTKVCYHCHSTDHLLAQCNQYMQQKIQKKNQHLNKKGANNENGQPKQVVEKN